jgi:hypothetical protein
MIPGITDVVLTDTYRLRNQDGGMLPTARYVWRGPAHVPVFSLENCRDVVSERIDVVCERPCEAIVICERTRDAPGTIPSTMHGFTRWRVQGNGLVDRGMWCRARIDANNEHMEYHANSFAGVRRPFVFEGQQSKHHRLTHNVIERYEVAVSADSGFHWEGGTIAVGGIGFRLTRVGDPVSIAHVGLEATRRILETSGPTTASQPVTLDDVRYEADQLHDDGNAIVFRHAGPLNVINSRIGGGAQRVPRIALLGVGDQVATINGNTFGAFGAHATCPVRCSRPRQARVNWGLNTYQRRANDPQNTESRVAWPATAYDD